MSDKIEARTHEVENSMGDIFRIVDVTDADMRKFVAKAYELSTPRGLGILHYEQGGLDESEIDAATLEGTMIVDAALRLDYVKGRAVKMTVFDREDTSLAIPDHVGRFIYAHWHDHTDAQLAELLEAALPD